jgi:hypothetical protein
MAFDSLAESQGYVSAEAPASELRVPGPSISLTHEDTQQVNLNYVRALIDFFGADTLALYDHIPCGWNKLKVEGYADANDEGRIKLHEREIKAAGEVINQTFPQLKFEPHLVGPDGKEIILATED